MSEEVKRKLILNNNVYWSIVGGCDMCYVGFDGFFFRRRYLNCVEIIGIIRRLVCVV